MVSRTKRPLDREGGVLRDASLMIIASEGEKTEPLYFSAFRSPKLQIICIPSSGGRSSPDHVLDALSEFIAKFDFGEGDEFWIVVDRDRWTEKNLSRVFADCKKKGVEMAVSNPFFEIWIALHFPNALPNILKKRELKVHLSALLGGYSKSNFDTSQLVLQAEEAVGRAQALDSDANHIWPPPPGSRVYHLMRRVLSGS